MPIFTIRDTPKDKAKVKRMSHKTNRDAQAKCTKEQQLTRNQSSSPTPRSSQDQSVPTSNRWKSKPSPHLNREGEARGKTEMRKEGKLVLTTDGGGSNHGGATAFKGPRKSKPNRGRRRIKRGENSVLFGYIEKGEEELFMMSRTKGAWRDYCQWPAPRALMPPVLPPSRVFRPSSTRTRGKGKNPIDARRGWSLSPQASEWQVSPTIFSFSLIEKLPKWPSKYNSCLQSSRPKQSIGSSSCSNLGRSLYKPGCLNRFPMA